MLRYRERSSGVTRRSLRAAANNLYKVGMIKEIKGYRYSHAGIQYEKVMVKGTRGTARFGGLCWGYCGEGSRGLSYLLQASGFRPAYADHIAFNSERKLTDGVDWKIVFPIPMPVDANPLMTEG